DNFVAWPDFYSLRASAEFSMTALPVPMADGSGPGSAYLGGAVNSITALNKNAADRVETLLQVMNWMAAPFGTAEYLFRKYGEPGMHYTREGTDPVQTDKGKSEVQLGMRYLTDAPMPTYQAGMPDQAQRLHDVQTTIVPSAIADPVAGLYSETSSRKGGQIGQDLSSIVN